MSEQDQRPAPLVPADADLQDFKFMPLHVGRLRDSDLASEQTPEENWAAVLLWAASWHQLPPASLPDVDATIAKWAGYMMRGKIDPRWKEVRDGAMRGFVLCSDGRWYHRVVSEMACEAWLGKCRHAYDKLADRTRKANKAAAEKGQPPHPIPSFEWWLSSGRPPEFPPDAPPASAGNPPEKPLKGKGQGKGTGRGTGTGKGVVDPAADGGSNDKRGTRLPADWKPTDSGAAFLRSTRPDLDLQQTADAFRDWWIAQPGRTGVKLDWEATWRNWVRNQRKGNGSSSGSPSDWWATTAGILAKATELGMPAPTNPPDRDPQGFIAFKAAVWVKAGDGPWWDDKDTAYPIAVKLRRSRDA